MFERKIINNPNEIIGILQDFTTVYKQYTDNPGKREVECMRIQYPIWMETIGDKDIFAGKGEFDQAIGFSPQPDCESFGFFLNEEKAIRMLELPQVNDENKEGLKELIAFWKEEDTATQTRRAYPESMAKALPGDNWTGESGVAFPLYRMSGTQPDYGKLLKLGLKGLIHEIESYKIKSKNNDALLLYDNMISALELLSHICSMYSRMAKEKSNLSSDQTRKTELKTLSRALSNISKGKPGDLYEAIQLSYIYAQFSGSLNYGRMDDYLGDFLVKDLDSSVLTEEQATELLCVYWKTIDSRNRIFDSRLTIGGKGRNNECNADRFAKLAMEATRRVKQVTPQLTLRFHKGQDPQLMKKALDVLAEGTTFPILYNDDVNIDAVAKAFDLPLNEAAQYIPFGCGEYTIYHKSVGTPSGVINMLQALIITLNNGVDPKTGKQTGLALGKASGFESYDSVYEAYKKQIEYFTEQLALQEDLEYKIAGKSSPFLFLSILYDDCVVKGKPIFSGGVRYLGGTLETYGNTNTADSLLAIKKLVFEQKAFSMEQLHHMMMENFEGFEKEQQMLLDVPKFGNDHQEADLMKVEVDRHICEYTRRMKDKTDLHNYLVVIINNNANTVLGRHTSASPDGRNAWTYMANGNAPTGGQEKNGLTSVLNSMVKPDITLHAGAVQNLKLAPSMFSKHRSQLEALLSTYFSRGGAQIMITVVNREDLENAMKEPHKYQHLVVRVGGYSARFVDLPTDVQQEVLSRTLFG